MLYIYSSLSTICEDTYYSLSYLKIETVSIYFIGFMHLLGSSSPAGPGKCILWQDIPTPES